MTPPPEAQPMLALWGTGAAIVGLLIVAAFLAGAEAALLAAGRGKLHGLADRDDRAAAAALALTEDKERLVGAFLFASTAVSVLAATLATVFFVRLLGGSGMAIAASAMTLLLLVFAQVMPRTWVVTDPEAAALRVARPIRFVVAVIAPIVDLVRGGVRLALGLFGVTIDPRAQVLAAQQEIAGAIALHHSEGAVESADRDRLLGALDLGQRRVEEVMMHRRDIEMIDGEAPPDAILAQAIMSPHTRIPIFRGEPENIVGVIHAKDLSRAVHRFVEEHRGAAVLEGFDIMDVAMPPYFVPESTPLDEQLREFLRRRTHFALVVDEYGALQGLVTLEDIIEEIVGDIADEHDLETPLGIEPQPDGSVEVEGGVSIRDLNRACDWELPDEEANTIAGLVIHEAQAIPSEGQVFSFHGLRFEVLARDGNRLARLRVRRLA
jgi:Mg2+/Co2+ transporter CorB